MRRIAFALLLAIPLAPAFAGSADDDIIAVEYAELPKLWTQVGGDTPGESDFSLRYKAGCARLTFIVEASGTLSTIRILGTFPDDEFGDIAEGMLKSWRFEPTELNAERVPAFTEHTIVWVAPGAERPVGNRSEKISPEAVAKECK